MSQGQGGGFGSNMGSMPGRQQSYTPGYNSSPAYGQARNFMGQGLQQMPQFGPRQGPFGGMPGNIMPPMGGGGFNPSGGGPISRGGGRDYVEWGPDSQMPGYGMQGGDYRPPGAPPVQAPPAFEQTSFDQAPPDMGVAGQDSGLHPMGQLNQGMNKPMYMPENSGLHPMLQQFQQFQQPYPGGFNPMNYANVAGFDPSRFR